MIYCDYKTLQQKIEEDYTNENKKLMKELEEYKMNNDNLEKKIKNVDDIMQNKQKDFESKIQQEKNKLEQKIKEYNKLGIENIQKYKIFCILFKI